MRRGRNVRSADFRDLLDERRSTLALSLGGEAALPRERSPIPTPQMAEIWTGPNEHPRHRDIVR